APAAGRGPGDVVLEQDDGMPLAGDRELEGNDLDRDGTGCALLGWKRKAALPDRGIRLRGLAHELLQQARVLAGKHPEQGEASLAARRLKVAMDASAEVEDLEAFVDDDPGRRKSREQDSVGDFLHL